VSGTNENPGGVPLTFETEPERYRHWKLQLDGRVARLFMKTDPSAALFEGVVLKLNSYDLGVDLELRDAVQRLRFEHPEVVAVVLSSALPQVFCAGANISMLARASHGLKVNFCKLTNETRLEIEDATRESHQIWIAALTGTASGGGYELALACERIWLIDDHRAAVSLPEVPLLAVLPGTGGLTRLVDKRKLRRDRADIFATLVEGVRGPRALEWGLVDAIAAPSQFESAVSAELKRIEEEAGSPPGPGIQLDPLTPEFRAGSIEYRFVQISFVPEQRRAEIQLRAPRQSEDSLAAALRAARELDDAILRLRFHHAELGLWLLYTSGDPEQVRALDAALLRSDWLAREVRGLWRRTLKRLENSARSIYAVIEPGSCFSGTFLELALAADRSFMLNDASYDVAIELGAANLGAYPMANGLTRLETRFLGQPEVLAAVRERSRSGPLSAPDALELGLVTAAPDKFDFDDELRVALEERASFSPDALTGMEASLRFAGPETLETKIFGRLSAWQNWVFQRPNATGPEGGLRRYGQPEPPKYDWSRT
jgi:benzoyl-CoA-dihydrodiol lyase